MSEYAITEEKITLTTLCFRVHLKPNNPIEPLGNAADNDSSSWMHNGDLLVVVVVAAAGIIGGGGGGGDGGVVLLLVVLVLLPSEVDRVWW